MVARSQALQSAIIWHIGTLLLHHIPILLEAAAMRNFDRHASKLTTHQAVSIACVLPNPLIRSPKTVSQRNSSKYSTTYKRTQQTAYPFNQNL